MQTIMLRGTFSYAEGTMDEDGYTTMTVRKSTRAAVFDYQRKGESADRAIRRAIEVARTCEPADA